MAMVGLMLALPALPGLQMATDLVGAEGGSPIVPEPDVIWTDSLDDLSSVYVPPGGLVGVEVKGGGAQLLPSATAGWIASEVIRCPKGLRYDLVVIEADTPGDSLIEVSVLDATEESSVVGFANATIPGFVKLQAKDVSVFSISPLAFPEIRVQVNLVAAGSSKPSLLSWTLHYVGLEEWKDEFIGSSKLSLFKGINFTSGALEINLTKKGAVGGPVEYEDFPPSYSPRHRTTSRWPTRTAGGPATRPSRRSLSRDGAAASTWTTWTWTAIST